jgi:hypothetical protein
VSEFDKAMTVAKLKGARDRAENVKAGTRMLSVSEGQSWSRLHRNCTLIPTDIHPLSALLQPLWRAGGSLQQAGGTIQPLPSLRCSQITSGRAALRKSPRPLAKLPPFEKDCSFTFRLGGLRPAEMLVRVVIESLSR